MGQKTDPNPQDKTCVEKAWRWNRQGLALLEEGNAIGFKAISMTVRDLSSFEGLDEEPTRLTPPFTSFLASLLNHLGECLGVPPPAWAQKNWRLATPWFVSGYKSLEALELAQSPPHFRKNNIFVTEDVSQHV